MRSRTIRLSKSRRMVIDLLHFAKALPTVPVQRRMSIKAVVDARAACREPPQWAAIFIKAYALVGQEYPVLRRAYVKFPWPHLSEYPMTSVSIMFERDYEGEPSLFSLLVKNPAALSLGKLRALIGHGANAPISSVKDFERFLRLAVLPRPLRRLIWWFTLNASRQRGNYYGTFGLSVYSALNVDSLHPLSPLTTLLNYGFIQSDGQVNVRIMYDHRVMDGATVARAMGRLEEILNGPIVQELRSEASPHTE
jgi:hypothetical protein